jgi:hypothetical protein
MAPLLSPVDIRVEHPSLKNVKHHSPSNLSPKSLNTSNDQHSKFHRNGDSEKYLNKGSFTRTNHSSVTTCTTTQVISLRFDQKWHTQRTSIISSRHASDVISLFPNVYIFQNRREYESVSENQIWVIDSLSQGLYILNFPGLIAWNSIRV